MRDVVDMLLPMACRRDGCEGKYTGISCNPPWHFFGWYEVGNAEWYKAARDKTKARLRFGERVSTWKFADGKEVETFDMWILVGHIDLSEFWRVYSELSGKSV